MVSWVPGSTNGLGRRSHRPRRPNSTSVVRAIEAVTGGTDSLDRVAGKGRANTHAGDSGVVTQALDVVHQQHGAGGNHRTVAQRHILCDNASPEFGLQVSALGASVGATCSIHMPRAVPQSKLFDDQLLAT